VIRKNEMDFNCKYIDKKEGYCGSPETDDLKIICFCSNYKDCFNFPKAELKDIIKPEKENDLEKEAKK
jgi:hypothetical protein